MGADSYEGQVCYRKEIQEGRWPTAVGTSEIYFTPAVVSKVGANTPTFYCIFCFKGIPIVSEDVKHFSGFGGKGKACPGCSLLSIGGTCY